MGVCHGAELVFVFGADEILDAAERGLAREFQARPAAALAARLVLMNRAMVGCVCVWLCAHHAAQPRASVCDCGRSLPQLFWTNFAAHGDPNGPAGSPAVWPRYDAAHDEALAAGGEVTFACPLCILFVILRTKRTGGHESGFK